MSDLTILHSHAVFCKKHQIFDPSFCNGRHPCKLCGKTVDTKQFSICTKCSLSKSHCLFCGVSVDREDWKQRRKQYRKERERERRVRKYWKGYCLMHDLDLHESYIHTGYCDKDRKLREWMMGVERGICRYIQTGETVKVKMDKFHFRYPPKSKEQH